MKNILHLHFPIISAIMAAPKRKENPNSRSHAGGAPKKPRGEEKLANDLKRVHELETATDSDPIVESDTTSQSGDDDGIIWPSDEEVEAGEESEGDGIANDNKDGGMKIAEAATASNSAINVPNTNGTAQGMSDLVTISLLWLTSEQEIRLKRHMQSKRLKSKSAKPPSPTQIQ